MAVVKEYSSLAPDSAEGRMVAGMQDAIETFEQLFAEGLADASQNVMRANHTLAGNVLFSDRVSFSDQVDAVVCGNFPKENSHVYVGETPSVLQNSGVKTIRFR